MKEKNSIGFINLNSVLYETINNKNKKISLFNKNKHIVKNASSKFLKVPSNNNQNLDEDDIKNNQNFNAFMKNLLKKDDDDDYNEISKIYSKNYFLRKKINVNALKNDSKENHDICYSSRNEKIKIYSIGINKKNKLKNMTFDKGKLKTNEIVKRSIGSECKIFQKKENKNSRNNILKFNNNTTFQEFDGKMLFKPTEKKYLKKFNKRKIVNSFNSIKKVIPKNVIEKILFTPNIKKEKENKSKLITMKENVLLFLKDKKTTIDKKNEIPNSINSYFYTNEKINLSLNKKYSHDKNGFPLTKLKSFYNEKDLIQNIKNFKILNENKVKF